MPAPSMNSVTARLRNLTGRARRTAAAPPTEPAPRRPKLPRKNSVPTRRVPLTDARVAVAGSTRVAADLSWEWNQTTLTPQAWRSQLTPDTALLVVEVSGVGTVAGWVDPKPAAAELAAVARERGVPAVAWVTSSCPTDTADALRETFNHVLVDAPATQVRAQTPAHDPAVERPGDVLVLNTPGRGDEASRECAPVDLPAPNDSLLQALRRGGLTVDSWSSADVEALPSSTTLPAQYRVFLDVGERAADAVTPLLDAIATRTAVVSTAAQVHCLPPPLREHVTTAEPANLRRQAVVLAIQPELRDRVVHCAHRALLQGHTVTDRARSFLETAGVDVPAPSRAVSIVVPTNRPHQVHNALANAARQTRVDAELVLLTHGIDVNATELAAAGRDLGLEHVTVVPVSADRTLGAVLNQGVETASGAYIAKMDDDNYYGAEFLADLVDAFGTTSAGITGKWAHYVWLRASGTVVLRFEKYENTYHRLVQGGSIVVTRDVAQDILFSNIPRAVDSDFLNRAMAAGVQTWSGDRFNFISIRGTDRHSHTWQLDDLAFLTGAGRVVTHGDPTELVTV